MNYLKLFKHYKISESYNKNVDNDILDIEDFFLELKDHKNSNPPINVYVEPHTVNNEEKSKGYKVKVEYDMYDQVYVEDIIRNAIERLKPMYFIHYSQKTKFGGTWHQVPVYGKDYTRDIFDKNFKWTITLSKKKINESIQISPQVPANQNLNQNLIIVDVQKSFKKFFNDNYVNALKQYAKTFVNVYQIWDNHVEGPDKDGKYLYDGNPNIPVHDDLYHFPNQKQLVEKRYNYDVDIKFYRKILNKDLHNDIREKEKKNLIKKGQMFITTEGTAIVYIGNNHKWFHIPKKLYNILVSLKGLNTTIVGGSDLECLSDIVSAAQSIGVIVNKDYRYIYNGSHCPIK